MALSTFLGNLQASLAVSAPAAELTVPMDYGASVHLLGRRRRVIVEGRNRYVIIKGEKIGIAKARQMDKEAKKKKSKK